jgi:hypothetical protein
LRRARAGRCVRLDRRSIHRQVDQGRVDHRHPHGDAVEPGEQLGLVEDRMSLAPFGTTRTGEWSAVTLAEVGLYLAHLEPDPAVRWTRERIAHLADEVHALIGG